MPFHLWSTDTPEYVEKLLPKFNISRGLTNKQLANLSAKEGSTDNVRRISHLTQYWYVTGLLNRVKDKSAFVYSLSDYGKKILNLLNFNKSLCFDLLHFSLLDAWVTEQNEQWGWSWVYKNIVELLWEAKPTQVDQGKILSQVINISDENLPDFNAKINPMAVSSTLVWLSSLIPPFLIYNSSSLSSQRDGVSVVKRPHCNLELLLLSVGQEYKRRNLPFNTALLIDEEFERNISKICLIDVDQFWPMLNLAFITFHSKLQKQESLYGTSVILKEEPEFSPPHPRSID